MGGVGPLIKCLSYRSYPQTPEPNGSQQPSKARTPAPPYTQRERGLCMCMFVCIYAHVVESGLDSTPMDTVDRRLKSHRPERYAPADGWELCR